MVAVAASIDPRFSAEAFSLTPDPARLFLSHEHARALAQLRDGLERRRGLVVVVGEVGTGKTTLAYAWLSSLGPDVRTAYIGNTRVPFEGLVRHALTEFGVACEGRDRLALLGALGAVVDESARAGRQVVLVIDEAQSLDDDTFEQLAVLGGLQLVLLGQPELDARLRAPRLRALAERVAVRVELPPMDRDESRRYVRHRLEKSGGSAALFADDALELVLDHAAGIPRRMNVVCHNALLLAFAAGAPQVTRLMVAEAIHELGGGSLRRIGTPALSSPRAREQRARLVRQWSRGLGLGLAVGAVVVGLFWRPGARPAPPAGVPVTPPSSVTVAVTEAPPAAAPSTLPVATVRPTAVSAVPSPPSTAALEVTPSTVSLAPPAPTVVPAATAPSSTVAVTVVRPSTTLPAAAPPSTLPAVARAVPVPVEPPVLPPVAAPPVEMPPTHGVSDAEVRELLARYERAWRTGDVAELRRIGQIGDDRQAEALSRYLESVRDLDVRVRLLELGEAGERRAVRFTRQDRFRDPLGREVIKESPPIEKTVGRTPGGVRFVPHP
jgi:general secretion pathway protein A